VITQKNDDSEVSFDQGRTGLMVEVWKQAIEVQQHFNDICWRIRSLALTGLTLSLSAAGYVFVQLKDSDRFSPNRSAALVCIFGAILWGCFWYLDRAWYHRLLRGAVEYAQKIESDSELNKINVRLATYISAISRHEPPERNTDIDSRCNAQEKHMKAGDRLNIFYGIVFVILLVAAFTIQRMPF